MSSRTHFLVILLASGAQLASVSGLKTPNICKQPPEQGPCLAYIERYYYNAASKSCKPFIYGGCLGNGNRFDTELECKMACGGPDVCKQPPEKGPCLAYVVNYYYNATSKSCNPFIYGGCLGNGNQFDTELECMMACGGSDICKQPPEQGPCLAYTERYYYNEASKSCKPFIYGGCLGNGNRFDTVLECTMTCGGPVQETLTLAKQ